MAKYLDSTYFDTVDGITNIKDDLINNHLYTFNDKKPTKVEYYNVNLQKSTLDPGSKIAYDIIGPESPIRFNLIHNMYLYGNNGKIQVDLDNSGDFGMESNPIEGEFYLIPNTIVPTENDFFIINNIGKDQSWLFRVNNVELDTLPDSGANVYKINWQLDRTNNHDITPLVVEEYRYLGENKQGTNIKAVVLVEKYELAKEIDILNTDIKGYFKDLFYSDKVQTFIYRWAGEAISQFGVLAETDFNEYISNMYDPFAIQFIINNSLLEDNDQYLYVRQQTQLPDTFKMDYNRSILHAFETCQIEDLHLSQHQSQADIINDITSIFNTRYELYFKLNYHTCDPVTNIIEPKEIISIMDDDLVQHIIDNAYYDTSTDIYKNIFIKYFNDGEITTEDLKPIRRINISQTKDSFYMLLFLIFCLDKYTQKYLC